MDEMDQEHLNVKHSSHYQPIQKLKYSKEKKKG